MYRRGLRVTDVATGADVSPRTMTEYLAGRKRPTTRNVTRITTFLKVRPESILEKKYPWLEEDQLLKEALETIKSELASDVEAEVDQHAKELAQ